MIGQFIVMAIFAVAALAYVIWLLTPYKTTISTKKPMVPKMDNPPPPPKKYYGYQPSNDVDTSNPPQGKTTTNKK